MFNPTKSGHSSRQRLVQADVQEGRTAAVLIRGQRLLQTVGQRHRGGRREAQEGCCHTEVRFSSQADLSNEAISRPLDSSFLH